MNSGGFKYLISLSFLLLVFVYFYVAFNAILINDDYMAVYTSWLLSIGRVPEIDFNIDSYTLLFEWMQLPFLFFFNKFEIVYFFRTVFIAITGLVSWQVYNLLRLFFSKRVSLVTILLWLSTSAMVVRGLDIRPDLVILSLWLQILIVLYLRTYSHTRKMFYVGVLLCLAMLFKFKAIVICTVIGFYMIVHLISMRSISSLVRGIFSGLLGVVVCISLFVFTTGTHSLELFYQTTRDLMLYSAQSSSGNSLLKYKVLSRYLVQDFIYWGLAFIGGALGVLQWKKFNSNQKQCALALVFLAILSVIANPHYHAYNLITLYPLVALLVGFAVKYSTEIPNFWTKSRIYLCILFIAMMAFRSIRYATEFNNDHQVALHNFIDKQVSKDQAVFAFEGIGLFRPSTFNWRTSGIKVDRYHSGEYNVWSQILYVKPVLVIESYRIPDWLIEKDRHLLKQNYVTIAPSVLALGWETESKVDRAILRSGWYTVSSDGVNSCSIDGVATADEAKIWLNQGRHVLESSHSVCTLRWYFSPEDIDMLKASNLTSKPYLYVP